MKYNVYFIVKSVANTTGTAEFLHFENPIDYNSVLELFEQLDSDKLYLPKSHTKVIGIRIEKRMITLKVNEDSKIKG